MAIEIREIVIKATVAAGAGGGQDSAPTAAGAGGSLQECVDAVMQVIQDKNER